MEENLSKVWQNLSIWRKIPITIFFVMWLAFSGEAILSLGGNLFNIIIALCGLWLAYVVVAYIIAKIFSN